MLADLLALRSNVVRRTAQRRISPLIVEGQIAATGKERARRYLPVKTVATVAPCTEPDFFLGLFFDDI